MSFEPRGVIAYIDYKKPWDKVTDTEKILYDEWTKTKPVYIVEGIDPENGPFKISQYKTGGEQELVCCPKNWQDFEKWEGDLRKEYKKSHIV